MNRQIYKIFCFIFALLAIIFTIIGIRQLIEQRNAGNEYETIFPSETDLETTENSVVSETESVAKGRVIDFNVLQERNPDIYAWIEVPGTNVDYPILQHKTDNTYYLTHTLDHKETVAASIYTENYNSKDFEDLHTVIYGHNMKNGTMFRTLHNFEDYDFFQENRDVIVYLPDQTRYYEIFAAYTFDNRHLLFSYDWSNQEAFQDYIDEIMAIKDFGAYIDKDMDVTGEDKIITLSTCVNSGAETKRYLVQAVLVSIENNN